MAGLVVHFEIHASEPEQLMAFYSGLFGWEFARFGDLDYWSIDTGDRSVRNGQEPGFGINGGLLRRPHPRPEPGAPVNGASLIVGVDDADGLFARGLELGATEAVPLEDVPGVGRVGYLADPDGNVFGLITPVMD